MKKLIYALSIFICSSSSLLLADDQSVVSHVENLINEAQSGNQDAIGQLKQVRQLMKKNRMAKRVQRLEAWITKLTDNLNASTNEADQQKWSQKIAFAQKKLDALNNCIANNQTCSQAHGQGCHSGWRKGWHQKSDDQLIAGMNVHGKTWKIARRIQFLQNRQAKLTQFVNASTDQQKVDTLNSRIQQIQTRIDTLNNALTNYQAVNTTN